MPLRRGLRYLLLDLVAAQLVLDLDVVQPAARHAADLDAVHLVAPRVEVTALQRGGAGVPKIWRGLHLCLSAAVFATSCWILL